MRTVKRGRGKEKFSGPPVRPRDAQHVYHVCSSYILTRVDRPMTEPRERRGRLPHEGENLTPPGKCLLRKACELVTTRNPPDEVPLDFLSPSALLNHIL